MDIVNLDANFIWHPFNQHYFSSNATPIAKGKGAYLYTTDNQPILDLISSWWVNLHGHCHPEIINAITQQSNNLDHVIFADFTHHSAVELAKNLCKVLGSNFTKIFYSDNGSTAVEVAIKIAIQYWYNLGQKKQKILAYQGGYHGDTFGAMSLGNTSNFYLPFANLLFSVDFIPYPRTFIDDQDVINKEQIAYNYLENFLQKHGNETAALIVEPLVQGAAGMQMCRPEFLHNCLKMVRSYDILVIFDEVMTGFGRTGTLFAMNQCISKPDLVCLSKGITGGILPLAVTACTEKIYEAFFSADLNKTFYHGHSYTAHPLGCAAAVASLQLLLQSTTLENIANIANIHQKRLLDVKKFTSAINIRQTGTIAAFDWGEESTYNNKKSLDLRKKFLQQGLLLRPIGNTIYLMPPYCIGESLLNHAYDVIIETLS